MSHRETRIKPEILIAIGGVNQRLYETELPQHEFSALDGVSPTDFAGLQSRLWGKRLLQKYDLAVYGIHQFWTPLGYGGGLYQFDGTVDFGPWVTPTTIITLTPVELPIDGGGLTVDEFGVPTWQTPNTCLLSFLNGSTVHTDCYAPVEVVGTPDDSNGGPGGGKVCKWSKEGEPTEHALAPLVVSGTNGTSNFSVLNTEPPFNEPYSPVPLPRRLPQMENTKPIYVNSGETLAASASSSSGMGHVPFVGYNFRYEGNAAGGTAVIDFTPVVDLGHLPGRAELFVEHLNEVAAWEGEWIQVPIRFDGGAEIDYRYNSFKIDMWDYIVQGRVTNENGANGYNLSDSVRIQKARFIYRVRICT